MKHLSGKLMVPFLIAMVLAACAGGSPTVSAPATGGPANSGSTDASTKLLVGTDATFPPFESLDVPRRKIVGFDVDLMNAIAAKAGLQIEIVGTRYGELIAGIAQCQYAAGISAIPITDDLKGQMLFSDSYFTNGQVVVVKKGNLTISGRDTLAGMKVGAWKNTTSELEVGQIPGAQLETYPSAEFAFRDLAEGLIDAVVADKLLALSYVGVKPNNLKIVGDEFTADSYGIAICNQRSDLLKKINAGLAAVKADGTLSKIQKKWLNSP